MRLCALLLLCLLVTPGQLTAQEVFKITEITEGVYAAIVNPRPPMYVFANSLIVINEESVLVVDTHQSLSAARALLAEIRKLTDKPVRTVVNTHWHGDHVYGNQVYRQAFPDVKFIGHHTTREDVLGEGTKRLQDDIEQMPASIEQRQEWLRTGKGPNGQPLSEEDRAAVERSARLRKAQLAELRDIQLLPPGQTFDKELILHRSQREIRLLHFGPAHTRGDVVVYLPQEKILAVGDLLEDAFPYLGDSYPSGWADVLAKVGELDADTLLPSHGPLQTDRILLQLETRLFRVLADKVAGAVNKGLTLEETQAQVKLEEFREFFTGGNPARNPSFDRNVAEAVKRAYREAKGELR